MDKYRNLLNHKNALSYLQLPDSKNLDNITLLSFINVLASNKEEYKIIKEKLDKISEDEYEDFVSSLEERRVDKIEIINQLLISIDEPESTTQDSLDEYLFYDSTSITPIMDSDDVLYCFTSDNKVVKLHRGVQLGKGTYGNVYLYSSRNIKYAVKFASIIDGIVYDGNERKAILELKHSVQKDSLINARIIECNRFASMMPVMENDLNDMNPAMLNRELKIQILDLIRTKMECIIKLNSENVIAEIEQKNFKFAYIDLKPGNILYQHKVIDGVDNIVFHLGDLGSVIRTHDGRFMSSIPIKLLDSTCLFIDMKNNRFPDRSIVKCMRYVFGVLAYTFLKGNFDVINVFCGSITSHDLSHMDRELVEGLSASYANLLFDVQIHRTSMYNIYYLD